MGLNGEGGGGGRMGAMRQRENVIFCAVYVVAIQRFNMGIIN